MNMTHPDILKTEREGRPEDPQPVQYCEHCTSIRTDEPYKCDQCGKSLCKRCVYVTNNLSHTVCTEILWLNDEWRYMPSGCLEDLYASKLLEAEDRIYDQAILIKKLQSDLGEKL